MVRRGSGVQIPAAARARPAITSQFTDLAGVTWGHSGVTSDPKNRAAAVGSDIYDLVAEGSPRESPLDQKYIYRRGNRWRVEKRVGGGYTKISFDTLEAAIAYRDGLVSRLQHQRQIRRVVVTGQATVGELVDLWFNGPPDAPSAGFRHRKTKPVSPSTVVDFKRRIETHISLIAHHDIRELQRDPVILDVFLHETLTTENARKAFTILNLAFKAALRGKLGPRLRIQSNPCEAQQLAPANTTARGVPTGDEVAKILLAASGDEDWDMFCRLTATLGTRRGETCALCVNDFDFAHRRVYIDESATSSPDGGVALKPPKSWRPRTLLIPHEPFWASMSRYVNSHQPDAFLFAGWARAAGRHTRSREKCWHPSSASHRFAQLMSSTGLVARDTGKPFTLHSLRHFVATALYNRTHDWVQVAKFLGHQSPAITMRLYANHVVEDSQRELGAIAAIPWWGAGDALAGADALR